SEMASRAGSSRGELSRTQEAGHRFKVAHGLRKRRVPECGRMLEPPHGNIHDPGECLHTTLWVLRRSERRPPGCRLRRAAPRGRGLRGPGPEIRGDYEREPRRPEGW